MRIFRLHRRRRPAADFSGSLLFAGRWNPAGTPLLYASTALSLACLELLVHLAPDEIPADYVYTSAETGVSPEGPDFRGNLKREDATRRYGHSWATSQRTLAIYVPSVIIPSEFNVLLNPLHPEFGSVIWNSSEPFEFDQRLLRRSSAAL
jgi:RES domain-containing protein